MTRLSLTRRLRRGCRVFFATVLTPVLWCQSPCARTPAGAVLHELGMPAEPDNGAGFRVRDVVLDAALHRSFVRVEQCGHPERPAMLLPFAASGTVTEAFAASTAGSQKALGSLSTSALVQAGTSVEVAMLDTRSVVLVRGRLMGSAAVGSEVDVEIAALGGPDAPARHVHGHLAEPGRVEVRP